MDKLTEFVDRLCIDERLYWRVPHKDQSDRLLEVAWTRSEKPSPWRLRTGPEAQWLAVPSAELNQALASAGADLAAFERQLGASILTQAVFADLVLEGATQLFGDEVVQRSIRDTRAFLAGVSEAAQRMTQAAPSKPPRLRLISR